MLKKFRKTVSGAVFWMGMIIIGIFAVPTAVFIGLISFFLTATDYLMNKLNKD
ncbi:MAG: hypothetical protein J1F23_05350 [Oscillospiraceae bacterium]|nr:hypothetical protein [Oscillospiraceae bacterium]